jgi:hypothetical protein
MSVNWAELFLFSSESAINIPIEMIHYEVTKTVQLALARGLAETTAIPTRCHYADSQISGSGLFSGAPEFNPTHKHVCSRSVDFWRPTQGYVPFLLRSCVD